MKLIVSKDYIKNACDAVRFKSGETDKIRMSELAKKILSIPSDGSTLLTYRDEDFTYIRNIPNNSCDYCLVNEIGGMSKKSNNILIYPDLQDTLYRGVTYNLKNGVITANGTATFSQAYNYTIARFKTYLTAGTYYAKMFYYNHNNIQDSENKGNGVVYMVLIPNDGSGIKYINTTQKITLTADGEVTINIMSNFPTASATFTNAIFKPMLVKGDTAPTEFEAGFEGIRNSKVTEIISKNANGELINTYSIPNEVQALEGYGQSNPENAEEYNYLDFDNTKFISVGHIVDEQWVVYETPLETDVSNYLKLGNVIKVEKNGSIILENEYRQDVPSIFTYQEKLGE